MKRKSKKKRAGKTGSDKTHPVLESPGRVTSDDRLSAEEVEGHGGEERRHALLVVQVEGHHLAQGFGELGLHQLHASIGALKTHKHTHLSKDIIKQ